MSGKNELDFPVDLVYLWVDGNDKKWQEKKNYYLKKETGLDIQATCDGRFIDNDELKYSLRSAEKYVPWINKIFIITDEQVPSWLNVNHPKIQMVFHKDIMPKEILPTFNSCAIECFLADIPGLSEHFIYANDDMFFNFSVDKNFFFNEKGYPIVRVKKSNIKKLIKASMYSRRIFKMIDLINKKSKKKICYTPHHNVDSYLKTDFIKCREIFREYFETTSKNRFRKEEDIERFLINLYQAAISFGNFKEVHRYDIELNIFQKVANIILNKPQADSKAFNLTSLKLENRFRRYNPKLFCFNDGEEVEENARKEAREFLEKLFSDKSSFEI